MNSTVLAPRGALWAQAPNHDDPALPLWKAVLIALALELLIPVLIYGVDWSFLPNFSEPLPTPVMSVRLEQPPPPEPPRPEVKRKEAPRPLKKLPKLKQVEIELPKPLPDEALSKIALPKPEPEPKPEPKPREEKKPEPEPQPEVPPLPSVFRDVKPVKKVKPAYPPEAEAQHIQGRVKVRLSVDLEGKVTDARVLSAEPPGVFEEAVLTAVRQYQFKKDGTTYQADQEILFKIDE
jgi:periplasmic protein TonB